MIKHITASIVLWIFLACIIYFVDPNTFGIVPIFFIILFVALFNTSRILLKNKRRQLIISLAIILFVILKFFGMGNIVNLLLLVGIVLTIETWFWYTKSPR